jgi:hypothetical protein
MTYMHLNLYIRIKVELRDPRVPSKIFLQPEYQYIYQIHLHNATTTPCLGLEVLIVIAHIEQYHVIMHTISTIRTLTKRRIT